MTKESFDMSSFDRGTTDYPERIAAAVIMQCVRDLEVGHESDALSAARFLFGAGEPAAGWLGVLGVTPSHARKKISDYFYKARHAEIPAFGKEVTKKQRDEIIKGIERKRKRAYVAMSFIERASQEF